MRCFPLWYSLEVLCLDLTTELLLMDKILHRQGWWLSPLLTRLYIHPRWLAGFLPSTVWQQQKGVAGLRHWLKDALPSLGQRTTRLGGDHQLVWFGWMFVLYFLGEVEAEIMNLGHLFIFEHIQTLITNSFICLKRLRLHVTLEDPAGSKYGMSWGMCSINEFLEILRVQTSIYSTQVSPYNEPALPKRDGASKC